MPRLLLDGVEHEAPPTTWRHLLEELDRRCASSGHIVTDVRFDGLDEPAFREPRVLEQPLDDFATVEVTSGTPESLMQRCLWEAAASIEPLCEAAAAVAGDFRGFEVNRANAGLLELADGMSTLIAIAGAANLAAKGGPGAAASHPVGPLAGELTSFIDSMIQAQQIQDWIALADILQYDVEPALRRWAPVFDAVAASSVPPAATA
jgi:hypothetical protein